MTKAAEETLRDDFVHELNVEPGFGEPELAPYWSAIESEHVSSS